jgi:hypothetical protein
MSDLSEHYGISPIGYGLDSPRPYPIIDIVKRMIDNGAFGAVGGPGGTSDHGLLTGLTDDDHPQYHNDARGDLRYAALVHTHNVSDITGLQIALDAKVDDSQISAFSLTLLDDADAAAWRSSLGLGTSATHDSSEYALAVHTHTILEVSGLQAALDGKAAVSHTHTASQITDFTTAVLALIPAGSDYNADETSLTESANTFSIKALGVATGHLQAASVTYAKIQNVLNDKVLGRFSGSTGTVEEISFTAGARAFSQLPDLAAQKTYLGIGSLDSTDYKDSVLVATTANITLSGEQTIDGVLTAASRVLVWQQTVGAENGLYLSGAGAWTRSTDADTNAEVTSGLLVPVDTGTAYADQLFQLITPDPIVLGTTALSFQSISAPPGFIAYKTVATTTYTNVLSDANKRLLFTNVATKTVTVAPQASVAVPQNTVIELWNGGAGALTVAPGAAVTINALSLVIPENGCGQLKKRANPNTWDLFVIKTGGLQYITEALNTAAPLGTNNVVSLKVTGGSTIAGFALVPKSTGYLCAAIPDGTSVGGNNRGLSAVDWQLLRGSADQVAEAASSTVCGGSGNRVAAGASFGFVGGGGANQVTNSAAGYAVIAGGSANTVTGAGGYAVIAGGTLNVMSGGGAHNTIGGGNSNSISTAAGSIDTIVGGGQNSITGSAVAATILGGERNQATGNYSLAMGFRALTRAVTGMVAHACAFFGATGDAQYERFVLSRQSTSATPVELTATQGTASASNQPLLPTGSSMTFTGSVAARTSGGVCAGFTFSGVIKNTSGTVSLVGTPVVNNVGADSGAAAWSLAVVADNTNKCLQLSATGAAATTINWVGFVEAAFILL